MSQEGNDVRVDEVVSATDTVTLCVHTIETADDQGPVGGLRSGYTQAARQVWDIPGCNDKC